MTKPKCLTQAQIQLLRRYIHFVGKELVKLSESEKLPDQWDQLNFSSFTMAAQQAVYDSMAEINLLPKQGEKSDIHCQFSCDHTCTLVGHAFESVRFLNQCMEHGIVKSAVEGDPQFNDLEVHLNTALSNLKLRKGG
jgi:hypothetical protein